MEAVMKVALIGGSGQGGSRLLAELSRRGHQVTAIARHPEKISELPGVTAVKGDAFDKAGLVALIKGHDAVISAVHFSASDPKLLIEAVKESGVKRYFAVGGAGSLEVAPGVKLVDTPQFPAAYKPEATKGGEFLDLLRQEKRLDWTFLSPSAVIGPGERTGKFRLGKDQLLTNDKGSSISWEDYAIAAVDELEKPAHIRERFTVGY
jgi:putative NADH-flavin reductase